jgi:hypothetical protein
MPTWAHWLIAGAALILIAPIAVGLGRHFGRKAARASPGLAMALLFFSSFLKIDPPPPPKAERVHKSEEDADAPLDP